MKRQMRMLGLAVAALMASASALAETKPAVTFSPAYTGNYTHYGSTSRGITYVVIHTIEGTAAGAISWFKNPVSKVSAHYIVDYSGAITQMVPDGDIGWHAGNYDYNKKSIGIEHAGYAGKDYWTESMMVASAKLTRWACLTYGIAMDRKHIIGHIEVPGATHTDPGPYFDWDHYMALVKGGSSGGGGGGVTPPPPTSSGLKGRKCTVASLNVRTGPSTSDGILGQVKSAQIYVSMTASGGWYKIWFKGNTGWCYGPYTAAVAGGTAAKVTIGALNVRTGPSTGYAVAGTTHSGEHYWVITSSSGWKKIYWGGGAYWVYGSYTGSVTL